MTLYKKTGLVNTKQMLEQAAREGYAVPAYNFNNMEQLQAIIEACTESKSPVILQVSSGARKYIGDALLPFLVQGAVELARKRGSHIPIALHLDHGNTFELCKSCIESGFSSVMIDGSHHDYEQNVRLTSQVVEFAHRHDVTVEGELGVLAGIEDDVVAEKSTYTDPDQVVDFVKRTGVDSLAVSIGTSHGASKFTPKQCTLNESGELIPPPLRFDILAQIEKRLPGFPIVLHGASCVPAADVERVNRYGGQLKAAIGIPEAQLKKAVSFCVSKINVDSDGRIAMTGALRKVFSRDPAQFDPRKYLGPARDALKQLYIYKNTHIFGSSGKANPA